MVVGCTSAAMVVTAIRGSIRPDTMGDLFVQHGYRSADNGTYYSAFRAVADEFNIEYQETYKLDTAVQLLKNNHIIICSVGNGLFTTGGHYIVLLGIDNDFIKIYDPYLYAGKFSTSTRRGKVTVDGNTVYCSIDNFRNYANYLKFFAYKNDGSTQVNNSKAVTTQAYTLYVKANGGLNVRSSPNGKIVGGLSNGSSVTVYETQGNWARIGTDKWVCSDYLSSYSQVTNTAKTRITGYRTGNYQVTASVLNVRTGAGTQYRAKRYYDLTNNARQQNRKLGNYYTNGYRKGVICTVKKVNGNWRIYSEWLDLLKLLCSNINKYKGGILLC